MIFKIMKFPPASDIKKMRRARDMTQSELASASGISQSTIAKIERGNISPSYDVVVKLFDTLEKMDEHEHSRKCAKDVMSKNIVSIQVDSTVHEATEVMKKTGYSQLPVLDGDAPAGSISEKDIFELITKGITMAELKSMRVSKVMDESYPVVPHTLSMDIVTKMMNDCNAILVQKNGKITGIITNADILKLI